MRYVAIVLLMVLSSCVHADYESLKSRVSALEKSKSHDAMLLAEQAGARKFWWKNGLSGGAASDLNGIAAASLTDGDAAIVAYKSGETTTLYFYIYDSDSTTDTSSPTVIEPNPLLGGEEAGAWFLANLQVVSVVGNAAAGSHYIEVYNDGLLATGDRAEGRCWLNTAVGHVHWECYSGSTIYFWASDGTH